MDTENIRLIVFDVDGTLAETDDFYVEKGTVLLCKLLPFVKPPSMEKIVRPMVMCGETVLHGCYRLLDMIGLDTVISKIHSRASVKGEYRYSPVEGIIGTLQLLSRSYKLGIISSGGHKSTRAFIEKFGLNELISYVIAAEDCQFIKPHPLPLKKIAEEAGVPINSCLMVGDTVFDIICARRAGAYSAAVKTGFDTKRFLLWQQPDFLLESVNDLADILPVKKETADSADKPKDLV